MATGDRSRTAELFRALGAQILVHDPYLDEAPLLCDERIVHLEKGLKKSRMVSLHSSEEDQILGQSEINLLQDSSFLLNSARGGLVCEDAVCDALDSGKLAESGLMLSGKNPTPDAFVIIHKPCSLPILLPTRSNVEEIWRCKQ